MPFVLVKEFEGQSEYINVPLKNNRLPVVCLSLIFPAFQSLFYRVNGILTSACILDGDMDMKGQFVEEPEGGWAGKDFFVSRKSLSPKANNNLKLCDPAMGRQCFRRFDVTRNQTQFSHGPACESLDSLAAEYTISPERSRILRSWIYVSHQGGKGKDRDAYVSVVTKKYAAGAAHCFPNAVKGERFRIINIDAQDDSLSYKNVKVEHVERPNKQGVGADLIIFSSSAGIDNLFDTPPIIQYPSAGHSCLTVRKGPFRPRDGDEMMFAHGLADTTVDSYIHTLGNNKNNAACFGGLVVSPENKFLGLITHRPSEYIHLREGLELKMDNRIEVLEQQRPLRIFMLTSFYIDKVVFWLELMDKRFCYNTTE